MTSTWFLLSVLMAVAAADSSTTTLEATAPKSEHVLDAWQCKAKPQNCGYCSKLYNCADCVLDADNCCFNPHWPNKGLHLVHKYCSRPIALEDNIKKHCLNLQQINPLKHAFALDRTTLGTSSAPNVRAAEDLSTTASFPSTTVSGSTLGSTVSGSTSKASGESTTVSGTRTSSNVSGAIKEAAEDASTTFQSTLGSTTVSGSTFESTTVSGSTLGSTTVSGTFVTTVPTTMSSSGPSTTLGSIKNAAEDVSTTVSSTTFGSSLRSLSESVSGSNATNAAEDFSTTFGSTTVTGSTVVPTTESVSGSIAMKAAQDVPTTESVSRSIVTKAAEDVTAAGDNGSLGSRILNALTTESLGSTTTEMESTTEQGQGGQTSTSSGVTTSSPGVEVSQKCRLQCKLSGSSQKCMKCVMDHALCCFGTETGNYSLEWKQFSQAKSICF